MTVFTKYVSLFRDLKLSSASVSAKADQSLVRKRTKTIFLVKKMYTANGSTQKRGGIVAPRLVINLFGGTGEQDNQLPGRHKVDQV
jgi:hypothetical protein